MKPSGPGSVIFIVIIAVAIVAGILVYRNNRNRRITRMLLSRWGDAGDRRFSPNEMTLIRGQAAALAGDAGFSVDDITWNDLDMDRLYASVNTTLTDAGDDALYDMLRNPAEEAGELTRRSQTMAWAREDAAGREKIKRILYDLGRTGNIDLQLLLNGRGPEGKRWVYIALSVSLAVGIVLCVFGIWPALPPTIVLAVANSVITLRSRVLVGKYFSIYQFIPAALSAASRVAAAGIPKLGAINSGISERLGRIRGILGNTLLNYYYSFSNQSVNNPVEVLMVTFNYFFLIGLISLYGLSRSVIRYRREIVEVFALLGELDALIAAASWRETLPLWCEPKLGAGEGGGLLAFEELVHPLMDGAVPNSLDIRRNVLLTGSNATGKSTFLKAVALNAILAQSLYTCAARSWASGFFRVYTSMALRDDLFGRESYFIAEVKSLKRMLDSLEGDTPCLCIVDEVLRGTNTGERIAAASEALRKFAEEDCLCLAATHDIELTYILEGLYENMHFTETVADGGISFDYTIRAGRATSRNAIKLLGLLGYGSGLVDAANARLEAFEQTGRWGKAGE